jgi:dihydroorotate dehydrogenase (NAD+) catalytic subunit
MPERQPAPFGRRACEVAENRASGGYRLFSLLDPNGPEPQAGQFYMLATESHWQQRDSRPFLPRAFSVAEATAGPRSPFVAQSETNSERTAVRLDFLVEAIGPGTERLRALEPGERVWVNGPLGNSFTAPKELSPDAAGAILVGGGIGIAPLAIWRRKLSERNIPARVLLGFRDEAHSGGLDDLFGCCEVGLASDDGHIGHHGYVTDLLTQMLEGDDAKSAAVYACGPPPMLDAVKALCQERDVAYQLAMESPMACGYGACYGCAVPNPDGEGYIRLCVDGPVVQGPGSPAGNPRRNPRGGASPGRSQVPGGGPPALPSQSVEFCGLELRSPVINASGTFDAIAARCVYGDELLEDFPFAAFVSKTITLEPRVGNEPQRIWETPAGMINSIGLPNKGLEGFIAQDLPQLGELPVPLIVSVMATGHEDFARMIKELEEREEVAGFELNVSCPNVHSGLIVGEQPTETAALLEALRPLTRKPLIVKLTPNVADPAAVAVGAQEGGADAVSLINTVKAAGGPVTGGLSGPAIRPVAVAQVRAVAAAIGLPIVGMGGISSGADAAELLDAGATLVAVGTESFRDPRAGIRIAAELSESFERSS